MANKYIIEGAAFNGDGTSSAVATSNGGVGAWNTITYFEGATPAYGSIAAGDTVYIRSKTAAGADITRTLAANISLGSLVGATNAWVAWVVDDDLVWPGVSGTIKYVCTSTYGVTFLQYNAFEAIRRGALVIEEANAAANGKATFTQASPSDIKGAKFDFSIATTSAGVRAVFSSGGGVVSSLIGCDFVVNKISNYFFHLNTSSKHWNIVDPHIEMLQITSAPIFYPATTGCRITVIGGRVFGPGATTGSVIAHAGATSSVGVTLIGCEYPKEMGFTQITPGGQKIEAFGVDGGSGAVIYDAWGMADSRNDGFYPTLNAYLPDSNTTPWSWKCVVTQFDNPMSLRTSKYFTGAAAQKTVTVEFLIASTLLNVDISSVWIDVCYIDNATGVAKYASSRGWTGDPLEVSDAAWSASTYGPVSLLKRRASVQTPTAIKQDTIVTVAICARLTKVSENDIFFVCPDAYLT